MTICELQIRPIMIGLSRFAVRGLGGPILHFGRVLFGGFSNEQVELNGPRVTLARSATERSASIDWGRSISERVRP
jgi:hypothetical protein